MLCNSNNKCDVHFVAKKKKLPVEGVIESMGASYVFLLYEIQNPVH